MATSFSETDDECIGSCSVCLLAYDEIRVPKLLTCGHTFCLSCIRSLPTQQNIIKCPTCRTVTDTGKIPLLTNFELSDVLAKLALKGAESKKNTAICTECGSSISYQKGRSCKTCDTPSSSKLCFECCVDKHNGHELVSLFNENEQHRTTILSSVEESRNTITTLQREIEYQQADISMHLATIQSLGHARHRAYDQEAMSVTRTLHSFGSKFDLEMLQQQESSHNILFNSTEAALKKIAKLNERIILMETAAIIKLGGNVENATASSATFSQGRLPEYDYEWFQSEPLMQADAAMIPSFPYFTPYHGQRPIPNGSRYEVDQVNGQSVQPPPQEMLLYQHSPWYPPQQQLHQLLQQQPQQQHPDLLQTAQGMAPVGMPPMGPQGSFTASSMNPFARGPSPGSNRYVRPCFQAGYQ